MSHRWYWDASDTYDEREVGHIVDDEGFIIVTSIPLAAAKEIVRLHNKAIAELEDIT